MAISLPYGVTNSGTNDWSDVHGNDNQLVTEFNNRDSTYQTIHSDTGSPPYRAVAGTYFLNGISTASPGNVELVTMFYFDDADYLVSSKTQKLRVRAQVLVNATAPAITYTVGLYPLTIAGLIDVLTPTLGTVVTGSTVALASPPASTVTQANSGDFTIPADGAYAFGVVMSATIANNSKVAFCAALQTRWV